MAESICEKFLDTVRKQHEKTAIMYKRGGNWNELTWTGYGDLVKTIAAGLQVLGVRKGDRVAICSNTRYEWAATDLAILGLGAITVPIYQSSSPSDLNFILSNSEARILICETTAMALKFLRKSSGVEMRSVESIIVFESAPQFQSNSTDTNPAELPSTERLISFDDLKRKGEVALRKSPTLYELAAREAAIDDPATIVYTSGTTGQPRGVLHSHAQILSEVGDAFPLMGATPKDRTLTFLPFAHVLGRIEIWGHALIGYTMAFATSVEKIREDLIEIKPTIIIAVPRIFEKIYAAVIAQAEISPIKNRVFKWAFEVGREISRRKVEKQTIPFDLAVKYQLARQLVFSSISEKMGGNLRFAVCGGAPLSQSIAEFFHAAGLLILEGYGLTETLACITVNTPFEYRFGTVGKAIGDVRLKFADDGEILVQSKKVMKSYYKDPETTAAVLKDGWFHTGDIGALSADGFLKITDRKKELIKTAGGKYVAPQKLESLLKANSLISQVLIVGDQRKFISALLTLNQHDVENYACQNNITFKDYPALVENAKIKDLIRRVVADANSQLASFESIKQFQILPHDFTVESGELTPSLKVKRKVVEVNYREMIERLYGADSGDL